MEFLRFAFNNLTAGATTIAILAGLLLFAYFVWRELLFALVAWRREGGRGPVNCPMLDDDFDGGGDDCDGPGSEYECDDCRARREAKEGDDGVQSFNN